MLQGTMSICVDLHMKEMTMAKYGARPMGKKSSRRIWNKNAGKHHKSNEPKKYGGRRR